MTNTWTSPAAAPTRPARPSWAQVLGWYAIGGAVTGGFWILTAALHGALHGALRGGALEPLGWLLGIGEIAALVELGKGRPRRCRIALAIGAVTPFVLVALFVLWLIWALAHSSWQF